MSIVKSPMGLMVGFMVIVMFLMPKLVENMGMLLCSLFTASYNSVIAFRLCAVVRPQLLESSSGLLQQVSLIIRK